MTSRTRRKRSSPISCSCARTCSQIGLVQEPPSRTTSCCGSRTGSDLRIRLLRIEKSAVLAPMPSASDSTAIVVTRGVARSDRQASRQSNVNRCRIVGSPIGDSGTCCGVRCSRAARPNQVVLTRVTTRNPRDESRPRARASSNSRQKAYVMPVSNGCRRRAG